MGRIDLVDVHGGNSSCGSLTGASPFLTGSVPDMCAQRRDGVPGVAVLEPRRAHEMLAAEVQEGKAAERARLSR